MAQGVLVGLPFTGPLALDHKGSDLLFYTRVSVQELILGVEGNRYGRQVQRRQLLVPQRRSSIPPPEIPKAALVLELGGTQLFNLSFHCVQFCELPAMLPKHDFKKEKVGQSPRL